METEAEGLEPGRWLGSCPWTPHHYESRPFRSHPYSCLAHQHSGHHGNGPGPGPAATGSVDLAPLRQVRDGASPPLYTRAHTHTFHPLGEDWGQAGPRRHRCSRKLAVQIPLLWFCTTLGGTGTPKGPPLGLHDPTDPGSPGCYPRPQWEGWGRVGERGLLRRGLPTPSGHFHCLPLPPGPSRNGAEHRAQNRDGACPRALYPATEPVGVRIRASGFRPHAPFAQ